MMDDKMQRRIKRLRKKRDLGAVLTLACWRARGRTTMPEEEEVPQDEDDELDDDPGAPAPGT
jgi:hypothetical protein